jgi:hypothetical protein
LRTPSPRRQQVAPVSAHRKSPSGVEDLACIPTYPARESDRTERPAGLRVSGIYESNGSLPRGRLRLGLVQLTRAFLAFGRARQAQTVKLPNPRRPKELPASAISSMGR